MINKNDYPFDTCPGCGGHGVMGIISDLNTCYNLCGFRWDRCDDRPTYISGVTYESSDGRLQINWDADINNWEARISMAPHYDKNIIARVDDLDFKDANKTLKNLAIEFV